MINRIIYSVVFLAIGFPWFHLQADIILLKDGKEIKTPMAWEEGDQVKCQRFGGTISYPKNKVEKIIKEEIAETDAEDDALKPPENKNDIEKKLTDELPPKNDIEKAANCTVTVKTFIGSGSGFFITSSGYILTNKHVVETDEKGLEYADRFLKQKKAFLDAIEKKLKSSGGHSEYQKLYESAKEDYEEARRQYRAAIEQSKYYGIVIVLVDGTEINASIVSISEGLDVALLKIDDYKTPFINPVNTDLAQGEQLYAIGSPLSLSHSVTAGIFSGYQQDFIQTNIPLNAGNSGGPLITKDGHVVGICTWKMVGQGVEGLSFAIPIKQAVNEFKELKGVL